MLKKFRAIVAAFLVVVMLFGTFSVVVSAATAITVIETKVGESPYTNSPILSAKLEDIFDGDIDVYSNDACTEEVSMPIDTNMSNDIKYYVKNKTTGKKVSGWQCYIYANAVYNKLFNETAGHGTSYSHSKVVISGGSNKATYQMFSSAGVRCGAYMRTTGEKSGAYNGNSGHSLIILTYNSSTITYLEGNGDGKGAIRISNATWSKFNSQLLSGSGKYISHVVQPTDDYYDSLYPDVDVNQLTVNYDVNGGVIGETYKVTVSDGLKVRSGPGTNYDRLGAYKVNNTFIVTEYKEMSDFTWGKVFYNDQYGWVALNDEWIIETDPTYYLDSSVVCKTGQSGAMPHVMTQGVTSTNGLYNITTFGAYKVGYDFVGWSASPTGDDTIFDQNQALCPEE